MPDPLLLWGLVCYLLVLMRLPFNKTGSQAFISAGTCLTVATLVYFEPSAERFWPWFKAWLDAYASLVMFVAVGAVAIGLFWVVLECAADRNKRQAEKEACCLPMVPVDRTKRAD